jgi:hypothetical protein
MRRPRVPQRGSGGLSLTVSLGICLALAGGASTTSSARAGAGEKRPDLPYRYLGSAEQSICRPQTPAVTPRPLPGRLDRVVVHYATVGRDAAPPKDKDHNGIPDYVECVQAAGSRALETYREWGLRPVRSDRSGGDGRPDIYLVKLDADVGEAFGSVRRDSRGDRFVVLSTKLEPLEPSEYLKGTKPRNVYQGVWLTLSHELFHVVQNAYMPLERMPGWIKEGTANAWMLLATGAVSVAVAEQIDAWLKESHFPIYSGLRGDRTRSYGSLLFWLYLQFPPGIQRLGQIAIPGPTATLFELLAKRTASAEAGDRGFGAVEQAFARWYPTLRSKHGVFSWFARLMHAITAAAPGISSVWPAYPTADELPVASERRARAAIDVSPLSASLVPIRIPKRDVGRILELRASRKSSDEQVFLAYGGRFGVLQAFANDLARSSAWRVNTGSAGGQCRMDGLPTQLDYLAWADAKTAKPDEPRVDCVRGSASLFVVNASYRAQRRVTFSYRLLPAGTETPGHDRMGDERPGAPDITRVSVAPARERITWTISATRSTLSRAHVRLDVDADANPKTGVAGGVDYYYDYNGPARTWALYRLQGNVWVSVGNGSASISEGEPFPLELWVTPTALGDPSKLNFRVRAWNAGTDFASTWDDAPSSGMWPVTTWKGYWP